MNKNYNSDNSAAIYSHNRWTQNKTLLKQEDLYVNKWTGGNIKKSIPKSRSRDYILDNTATPTVGDLQQRDSGISNQMSITPGSRRNAHNDYELSSYDDEYNAYDTTWKYVEVIKNPNHVNQVSSSARSYSVSDRTLTPPASYNYRFN